MFDLLIKNGRTIQQTPIEIAIQAGKIVEIAPVISGEAKEVLYLTPQDYLSAGWIDGHVHCYENMSLYYDIPDEVGVKQGVTTIVDAGSTGTENLADFYKLAQQAKTNVYALVNISKWGIVEQDELADLSKIQEEEILRLLASYPDFILGLKARMSKTVIGENGLKPLILAKAIQGKSQLPLMVHIGSNPPELAEIFSVLTAGDIITHCFNGKENGILDQQSHHIKDFVQQAYQKGLIFDIGHGSDSFNFQVAKQAMDEGIFSHTISTDSYIRNRLNGPVYNLATTMEKLAVVGYSWEEIIQQVTQKPAEVLGLTNKGQLKVGGDGDVTIFRFRSGKKNLTDSNGNTAVIHQSIHPVKTIIGGSVYDN